MRTLSGPVEAVLASGKACIVQLVKFAWPSGASTLNSSNWDIQYGGDTYKGAAGLGATAHVIDKPGELQGLQLEMLGVDDTLMALAEDGASEVQDAPVTIRTAIIDPATGAVLDAPVDWAGYADTMNIVEDGEQSSVALTTESKAVDLLRGNPSTYSDADQQVMYPGDRLFEFVVDQEGKSVVWPAKEWFYE